MRINGTFLGKLNGLTNGDNGLVCRTLEVYETKTKIKIYLFSSVNMYWHKKENIIEQIDIKINESINITIYDIIHNLMVKYNVKFDGKFLYNDNNFIYRLGLEMHEVHYGFWAKDINGNKIFFGCHSPYGNHYKDYSAWKNNNGVIYIGEFELKNLYKEYKENGSCNTTDLWTKRSFIEWVKNTISSKEMLSDDTFIEHVAYTCLENSYWEDLSTKLNDYLNNDTIIDMWEEWNKNK